MDELANCPKCGKLFVKGLRKLCTACFKEEEEMYELVYQFIRKRENREATITEVHKGTGVPEDTIIRLVKAGRLRTSQLANFVYGCETCGAQIQSGRICSDCSDRLANELHKHDRLSEKQALKDRPTYLSDRNSRK
jgi:flagellar operon protein (TIGR03826 family)